MPESLETKFHAAMVEMYRRAKEEANYSANRFIAMVTDRRGIETARDLLHAPAVSDGYTALWERGRLDLTVESLILQPRRTTLFTDSGRSIL